MAELALIPTLGVPRQEEVFVVWPDVPGLGDEVCLDVASVVVLGLVL